MNSMENLSSKLNIIFLFFDDDYHKWAISGKLNTYVDNNKELRFIGINYPVSLLTLFSNPLRFLRFLFRNSGQIRDNISFFAPFSFLPVDLINKSAFLIRIHSFIFMLQLNDHLKRINATENRITWLYKLEAFPAFSGAVKGSRLLVYSCEDEYTMKENTIIKTAKEMEDEVLKKADVVFAISRNIHETRNKKNKNCYYIPNGVDFKFFNKADSSQTELNEEIRPIPGPIAGYLGNIRSWLDFELLEFLADGLPKVSFVFVGPIEREMKDNVQCLRQRPNVYFLERKDREALPGVLKGFDICMIPFKYNQFNLSTNPLKFWEYLATGKPILSVRLPDLEPYEDVLSLYVNKEEALEKLHAALKERDLSLKERRMAIAMENDLSLRSGQYYNILLKHLNEKNRTVPK